VRSKLGDAASIALRVAAIFAVFVIGERLVDVSAWGLSAFAFLLFGYVELVWVMYWLSSRIPPRRRTLAAGVASTGIGVILATRTDHPWGWIVVAGLMIAIPYLDVLLLGRQTEKELGPPI
jgi:hypothetical protein